MYFILPTVAFFTITAAATAFQHDASSGVAHLRGGELDADQRALGAASSSSKQSKKLNFYTCRDFSSVCCFNVEEYCQSYADSYAYTSAEGTDARSSELLCVLAECEAAATAFAQAYVEVKGVSSVDVSITKSGSLATEVDVNLSLVSTTLAASLAATSAAAAAFASSVAIAYTDAGASAVCSNAAAKNFPLCNANAASKSVQLGTAASKSYSSGFSGAIAGSTSFASADVDVLGSSINTVKACVVSFAKSFTATNSLSIALAKACSDVFSASFNTVCLAAWDSGCNSGPYSSESFCSKDRQQACNDAAAFAVGGGTGFAESCAAAAAASAADAKLSIFLKVLVQGSTISCLENQNYGEACITSFC